MKTRPHKSRSPLTRRSSRSLRAATVRYGEAQLLVVEVRRWVVNDAFEAQLAINAIELTCGRPVVLWATEPCGCRDLYGRTEHIEWIDRLPIEALDWQYVDLDLAPATPSRAPN